jgi:hypothetical protein
MHIILFLTLNPTKTCICGSKMYVYSVKLSFELPPPTNKCLAGNTQVAWENAYRHFCEAVIEFYLHQNQSGLTVFNKIYPCHMFSFGMFSGV